MVKQERALKRLWKDRCTVTVKEKKKNPETKITEFVETELFKNEPCKLSFESLSTADGDPVATAKQTVKVFLSSDLVIPPGSKITVTHEGRTVDYSQSGVPGVYTYHQEIPLELFRGWA